MSTNQQHNPTGNPTAGDQLTLGRPGEHNWIAARGALFGAGLALVVGLGYLVIAVASIYLGPLLGGLLNRQAGDDVSITAEFAMGTAVGGLMLGVVPAVVLGALAGFLIGVLRQGSRSTWSSRRTWLTGTAVTGALAVLSAVVLVALTDPELLWSIPGFLIYTLPLSIFVGSGGPFAGWLCRRRTATARIAPSAAIAQS